MSQPWLTDIDALNRIADLARQVVVQPDRFRLEQLAAAIREAEDNSCDE